MIVKIVRINILYIEIYILLKISNRVIKVSLARYSINNTILDFESWKY